MPEIPAPAVRAAADAISRALFSGQPKHGTWLENDEHLARVAVEAAAPYIAERIADLLSVRAGRHIRSAQKAARADAPEAAATFSSRSAAFSDAAEIAREAFPKEETRAQ
jgi:hypothetical protein